MKKAVIVILFLVLVVTVALPVGATPPEDVRIEVYSTYTFGPTFPYPDGYWNASGVISVTGGELGGNLKHFGAGWPHGIGFQTTHIIETLMDGDNSILVSSQSNGVKWSYTPNANCETKWPFMDQHFEGSGNWVILEGDGAYENLHGRGHVTYVGDVYCETGTMEIVETYTGTAHFDPQ